MTVRAKLLGLAVAGTIATGAHASDGRFQTKIDAEPTRPDIVERAVEQSPETIRSDESIWGINHHSPVSSGIARDATDLINEGAAGVLADLIVTQGQLEETQTALQGTQRALQIAQSDLQTTQSAIDAVGKSSSDFQVAIANELERLRKKVDAGGGGGGKHTTSAVNKRFTYYSDMTCGSGSYVGLCSVQPYWIEATCLIQLIDNKPISAAVSAWVGPAENGKRVSTIYQGPESKSEAAMRNEIQTRCMSQFKL